MVWHCLVIGMVVGSSLGEPKLNFNFVILDFRFEFERLMETLDAWAAKGGGGAEKRIIKGQWMTINITIKPWIRFCVIT